MALCGAGCITLRECNNKVKMPTGYERGRARRIPLGIRTGRAN
jgi:hypothetical protein